MRDHASSVPRLLPFLLALVALSSMAMLLFSAIYAKPWNTFGQYAVSRAAPLHACQPCLYAVAGLTGTPENAINMTSLEGFGRTGNHILAALRAVEAGYNCKRLVILPAHYSSLDIDMDYRFLDFRFREGTSTNDTLCVDQLIGHSGFFFLKGSNTTLRGRHESLACLRWYLGICKAGYCDRVLTNSDTVLTLHIRQGDVFQNPINYRHFAYGQPPFTYYLAAMHYNTWSKVVVIGEPSESKSPIWHLLERSKGITRFDLVFPTANVSWADDLQNLLCARNLVMSRSTLVSIFAIGHASTVFASGACGALWIGVGSYPDRIIEAAPKRTLIKVPLPGNYSPVQGWKNTPEQLLEMMMVPFGNPMLCGPVDIGYA